MPEVRAWARGLLAGRGLWLVEAVATGWGAYRHGTGGTVWFRVTG